MPEKKIYFTESPDDYFMLVSSLNESKDALKVSDEEGVYEDSKTRYHFNDSTIELIGEAWHPLDYLTAPFFFSNCLIHIYAGDLTQIEDTKSKLEKIIGYKFKDK